MTEQITHLPPIPTLYPENETLYLRNLNEKVSINKLKDQLQNIFTKYGKILQITIHKNIKLKGQAFITFENKESSTKALTNLQRIKLFDKEIVINYAKKNSDSFFNVNLSSDEYNSYLSERKQSKIQREEELTKLKESKERELLKRKNNNIVESFTSTKKPKLETIFTKLPPNKTLLLQNLPSSITLAKLESIFNDEPGMVEIRLVKIRLLAFIEFENENYSSDVLNKHKSLNIDDSECLLTFAKA